jgi:hypothetical protein
MSLCAAALPSEARNSEPPCFADLEALQKKLPVDPSGQPVMVPDCGDATTLKILNECLNDDPDIRQGGRILALNDPYQSSKWMGSMKSACHIVVDTTHGAFGLRYGFDFGDNRLGMTYTSP